MGAWIEISVNDSETSVIVVAPLVGAWIEMKNMYMKNKVILVAPLVGAWIEILTHTPLKILCRSLPSWERGLKYNLHFHEETTSRRSPRGSVD